MNELQRIITYFVSLIIFIGSFSLMIYYGKLTFYVEDEVSSRRVYAQHFALITDELDNDYWNLIKDGAKAKAANHNIYLEYIGPRKSNIDEQLETLDRMISAKVDGVITQGISGDRFLELIQKAKDQDIPVATIDTDVPDSEREFYVGTNNYNAGYLAGETVIENTTGEMLVGAIIGGFDALNQMERLKGFKDAIKEIERVQLVDVAESQITEVGATQATYSLLKQHPQINALFGASALDGVGIVEGVKEFNHTKSYYIIAFDTLPGTLKLIEQGDIDATVVQYPYEMGNIAVEQMVRFNHNEAIQELNYTGTGVLFQEDIKNGVQKNENNKE